MAVRKRIQHKKTGFVSVLASGLSHYVPLFVFLALCLNVVVVWRFEERQKPQVMYYVATNSVAVSSSAAPGSPSPGSLVSGFPTNRLLGACSASNAVGKNGIYATVGSARTLVEKTVEHLSPARTVKKEVVIVCREDNRI